MAPTRRQPVDFPVLALVCSLGGAHTLTRVLAPLPADFPAAVVALQHLDPHHTSNLTERLTAATALKVSPRCRASRSSTGTMA